MRCEVPRRLRYVAQALEELLLALHLCCSHALRRRRLASVFGHKTLEHVLKNVTCGGVTYEDLDCGSTRAARCMITHVTCCDEGAFRGICGKGCQGCHSAHCTLHKCGRCMRAIFSAAKRRHCLWRDAAAAAAAAARGPSLPLAGLGPRFSMSFLLRSKKGLENRGLDFEHLNNILLCKCIKCVNSFESRERFK